MKRFTTKALVVTGILATLLSAGTGPVLGAPAIPTPVAPVVSSPVGHIWRTPRADGGSITLTLNQNGTFLMYQFDKTGAITLMRADGTYTFTNGQLSLINGGTLFYQAQVLSAGPVLMFTQDEGGQTTWDLVANSPA
jgi:hypothetical protein